MKTINIEIKMKKHGVMKAELYPEIAPITVENFVKLVENRFYDGLIFHRVIAGFMIQGGGYDVKGAHHEAKSIKGEFAANGVENNLKHTNLTNSHFLPIHRILQYYFLSLNNELKPLNDNVL